MLDEPSIGLLAKTATYALNQQYEYLKNLSAYMQQKHQNRQQ